MTSRKLFIFLFFSVFLTERSPASLLLCCRAHSAPPQTLRGGGVWRGSRPDTPHPSALHPTVSTTCGCSPSHTVKHRWVISTAPMFYMYTMDAGVRAKQMETLWGLLSCVCLCVVCFQPRAVKGGDAARVMPSVMEGQGESCWCSVCWHWPSGLEVYCVYSYRSLDIVIKINSLL